MISSRRWARIKCFSFRRPSRRITVSVETPTISAICLREQSSTIRFPPSDVALPLARASLISNSARRLSAPFRASARTCLRTAARELLNMARMRIPHAGQEYTNSINCSRGK